MAQWTIRKRVLAGFSVILALSLALAGHCVWWTQPAATMMSDLAHDHLPEMALATAFEREILNARIHFIYYVTIQKPGALEQGWQRFRNAQALMPKLEFQVQHSDTLADLRPLTADLERKFQAYELLLNRILGAVANHQNSGAEFSQLISEWANAGSQLVQSAGDMNRHCSEVATASAQQNEARLRRALLWMLVSGIFAAAAGLLMGWILTRSVVGTLERAILALNSSAGQVRGASTQVAASSQTIARSAAEEAASLDNTASVSRDVRAFAERNSTHFRNAMELVVRSEQQFTATNSTLDKMVEAIEEIGKQSANISKIIRTIDEIAFQTNLLALNAAVEAARAGEAGMGFAVVADEVRNLAQRSAQAAKDTAALIEGSIATSSEGKRRVDDVASAIRGLTADADEVKAVMNEMSQTTDEQSRGIERIGSALADLKQITHRNAASAEQNATASQEFSAQADSLHEIVGQLEALV
jgi:methyl-accepting chemotaxis protein